MTDQELNRLLKSMAQRSAEDPTVIGELNRALDQAAPDWTDEELTAMRSRLDEVLDLPRPLLQRLATGGRCLFSSSIHALDQFVAGATSPLLETFQSARQFVAPAHMGSSAGVRIGVRILGPGQLDPAGFQWIRATSAEHQGSGLTTVSLPSEFFAQRPELLGGFSVLRVRTSDTNPPIFKASDFEHVPMYSVGVTPSLSHAGPPTGPVELTFQTPKHRGGEASDFADKILLLDLMERSGGWEG